MPCCQLMLTRESLCLSTQSVISLSLKTLLNNVVSALFLLNSAGLLSDEEFRHVECLMGCRWVHIVVTNIMLLAVSWLLASSPSS
jgi:hypothetical protein